VEDLPPFIDDGRTPIPGQKMVPEFTKGTFAIPEEGDTRLVESSFGWHVVRLIQKLPAVSYSLEERRLALAAEAYRDRGKLRLDADLDRLRRESPPTIDPSASALMAAVVADGPRR
jgi:parvulin-like peptidyl-prolyl isomerase